MNKQETQAKLEKLIKLYDDLTKEVGMRGYQVMCCVTIALTDKKNDAVISGANSHIECDHACLAAMSKDHMEVTKEFFENVVNQIPNQPNNPNWN